MTKLLFRPVTWKPNKNQFESYGNGWYYDRWFSENVESVEKMRKAVVHWQSVALTTEYGIEHPDGSLELFLRKPA